MLPVIRVCSGSMCIVFFFFSSRRRHTRLQGDWSSDVCSSDLFDDKRVRQALNYAVNKEAIVRDVLKGTGSMSAGPVLPGTWGADAGLKPYPYDPERAKKLLADAGYPGGFTTSMWVPESGSGMQSPVAMATGMQSNLKA